jgi:hypothetical protein
MPAPRRRRALAAALAALPLLGGEALASPEAGAPRNGPRGEDLTITVLTFGPGDHPFYKFGHDAIWVHDAYAGEDGVYNYGMFSFDDPGILVKFFTGRFYYWLGREGVGTLDEYREDNRMILSQELDLGPAEKVALVEKLDRNALPENRAYKYDYYRDNCATRVRDLVDEATHGRLRAASAGPGRLSYRGHTLRMTWDAPVENLLLDFVMGPLVDRPITRYEEQFLPGELADAIRRTEVAGGDGALHPLVKQERFLWEPKRASSPVDPPTWIGWMAGAGVGLGASLLALGLRAAASRAARVALGVLLAALGLFFGFFGTFFLAAWAFTDHEVGYRNENVLLSPPWALALAVAGIALARGSKWAPRASWLLAAAAAASTLFALVSKALPWFSQHNARFLALTLPMWIGAAAGLYCYRRARSTEV